MTDCGDCGTIFVGLDGTPFYFHHCANKQSPRLSYGFPLARVMGAHTQLGGTSVNVQVQEEQLIAQGDFEIEQESTLKKFTTHVVPAPLDQQECRGLAYFPIVPLCGVHGKKPKERQSRCREAAEYLTLPVNYTRKRNATLWINTITSAKLAIRYTCYIRCSFSRSCLG
jgi:hypothetical protein